MRQAAVSKQQLQREVQPRRLRGQSTVEFMLMIPIIFAVFFFVIEMSLYFSVIHFTNYAAFTIARSKSVGYRNVDGPQSAAYVGELILTGSALKDNHELKESRSGITIQLESWKTTFPYLSGIMPDAKFKTTVNMGPDEREYEGRAFTGCSDNDMSSSPYNRC